MSRLLTTLTLAAALAVASAQQPLCDYARAKCDSDCQAGGLVATAFLCRDTPFGTLQSCTCGPQVCFEGLQRKRGLNWGRADSRISRRAPHSLPCARPPHACSGAPHGDVPAACCLLVPNQCSVAAARPQTAGCLGLGAHARAPPRPHDPHAPCLCFNGRLQVGGAELASSSESYSSDSSSSSSSSALPWVSSSSTDSSSGSSSSSEAAGEQTFLFFIPQSRRFGPFQQPLPLFQPPAQLADPFSAARVAHLSGAPLLSRSPGAV